MEECSLVNMNSNNERYKVTEASFKSAMQRINTFNNTKATIYFFNSMNRYILESNNSELKYILRFLEIKRKIERAKNLSKRIKNKRKYLGKNSPLINEIYNDLLFSIRI
ncbi:hypothetical protein SAMN02745163_01900 [Clostridium cavendishii DSM 21758]|uniref:Uncharacterized protein n=1 Tax=Clostridium cavendishii DSM 21758 TaxID=1121302 RepID=A0A1M6J3B5_9CLOT|nr:hypothetical protein [Clostridium cavendishii]SHJ41173.1 hypothetical protein SAMN02745163_01900 [Clostridium cavendishii DSM 21758]